MKLVDGKVEGFWPGSPVKGSPGFAIEGELTLFAGGYKHKANLYLVRQGEKRASKLDPIDGDGQRVVRFGAYGRGNRLFLQTDVAVYVVDVPVPVVGE